MPTDNAFLIEIEAISILFSSGCLIVSIKASMSNYQFIYLATASADPARKVYDLIQTDKL